MAVITNQPQQTWTARRIVAELPFIPAASNWLKLLLSLLAEPLMFVSSLYIVAETVIPNSANWPPLLMNSTNAVMSLAPEIILPGCFQQAQHAMQRGNKIKAWLLYGLCTLFGLLTLVTLASFVWHFTAIVGAALLFIRCGSGLGYTIILNISGPVQTPQPERIHPVDAVDTTVDKGQFDQLTETVNTLAVQVTQVLQFTQNNNFVMSGSRLALPEPTPSTSRLHTIRPVRISADAAYLLSTSMQTTVDTAVDREENNEDEYRDEAASEEPQAACIHVDYPEVPGFSGEKVKRIIDAFLAGTQWRDIGNYSRDVKPVREAWEALHTNVHRDVDTDEHPVCTASAM